MASDSFYNDNALQGSLKPASSISIATADAIAWKVLRAFGSLKITVTMFGFAILILFVGTLAQDEQTLVDVKKDYFNSWIAMVPHHVFMPTTIFGPHTDTAIFIPMPGGALIGLVLLVNLIAAKLTRFSMQAKGLKLAFGIALVIAGLAITTFVILNAHASNGLQGEPRDYNAIWNGTLASVYFGIVAFVVQFVRYRPKTRLMQVVLLCTIAALVGLAAFFAWYRIPDPGLRIIWQMFKSLIAGLITFAGLTLLFGKRGGNVLIHLAVGLLMLGQFVFGDRQNEEMIMLQSGQTSNMAYSMDEVELAIVEELENGKQKHIAVDQDTLIRLAGKNQAFTSDQLPFDIQVNQYMRNSDVGRIDESVTENWATDGMGKSIVARELISKGGAMSDQNLVSAYVTLLKKSDQSFIGTYLLSQAINDAAQISLGGAVDQVDTVTVDGKSYQIGIRFRRNYKPYYVTFSGGRQENYAGTNLVRDYSSQISIKNPMKNLTQDGRVWMNNPMRFDGETFYQSKFFSKEEYGVDTTGLQVVTNAGWLMPYLACVFAGLGMLAHFGNTFVRFAGRFDREVDSVKQLKKNDVKGKKSPSPATGEMDSLSNRAKWLIPTATTALIAIGLYSSAKPKSADENTFNWYKAGTIPAQDDGRLMPLDTVARRFLQTLSGATYTVVRGNPYETDPALREDRKISAVEFLFAMVNDLEFASDAKILRIDAEEVRNLLDLDPNTSGGSPGGLFGKKLNHRYSLNQIKPQIQRFEMESARVRELLSPTDKDKAARTPDQLDFADQKILELQNKLTLFLMVRDAFNADRLPIPDRNTEGADLEQFKLAFQDMMRRMDQLDQRDVPAIVPPVLDQVAFDKATEKEKKWRALNPSTFDMQFEAVKKASQNEPSDEPGFDDTATKSVYNVFRASANGSVKEFDEAVDNHLKYIATTPVGKTIGSRAAFEAWYNKFNPFVQSIAYYSIAVVLTLLSFVFYRHSLRSIAFWICCTIFVLHTAAIIGRIYISQRPPVINLYSSAVYIGWAGVLAGLVIEKLYPIRLGLLVGSVVGVLTLLVAWGLDTSDTMPVLQAVLDTQFWLTTHVQCITLGYAATFFAGFIAIHALIHRIIASRKPAGPDRDRLFAEQKIFYKLCYGIVCFGLFFSFIGTVLGGLWADDSWGRFWGWDPKENGALMIVLWNAILLHARWDRLVLERGFYLLAIGGNIMTAWSWFGTNQLGIGLHSYGFTSGVLYTLASFVVTQIALIIVGWVMLDSQSDSTNVDSGSQSFG
jgi:ABC-type transport system involved in cytochrome c biogenesis permease subunit